MTVNVTELALMISQTWIFKALAICTLICMIGELLFRFNQD